MNSLIIRPNISFQDTWSQSLQTTNSTRGKVTALNSSNAESIRKNDGYNASVDATFRHRFLKRGLPTPSTSIPEAVPMMEREPTIPVISIIQPIVLHIVIRLIRYTPPTEIPEISVPHFLTQNPLPRISNWNSTIIILIT